MNKQLCGVATLNDSVEYFSDTDILCEKLEAEAVQTIRNSKTGSPLAIVFRWQNGLEETCDISLFPKSLFDGSKRW